MKTQIFLMGILATGLLLVSVACGSSPTSTPALSPDSPAPRAESQPNATPDEAADAPGDFSTASSLRAVYADGDTSNDQSSTPRKIFEATEGSREEQSEFPRIVSAVLDNEGRVFLTFGAGGRALLTARFAATSSAVTLAAVPARVIASFPLQDRAGIFPPDYPALSPEEKVDLLLALIVAKRRQVASSPEIEPEKLAQKIWNELFPPADIAIEAQVEVLEMEYIADLARRGVILEFGLRPDGAPDYDILSKSVAKDGDLVIEIFERKPNPDHPFPESFPFQILGIEDLRRGDELVFWGNTPKKNDGQFAPTQKPASVSAVFPERSFIRMDGSVSSGDRGAPVFATRCGKKRLVGLIIGSLVKQEGKENEAFVVGIERILSLIEQHTGVTIHLPEPDNSCPEPDYALKERFVKAASDSLPDSSPDLVDIKNSLRDLDLSWVRPFENVLSPAGEPEKEESVMPLGNAFLVDTYVGALASAVRLAPFTTTQDGVEVPHEEHKYRIVWGGTIDGNQGEPVQYEYVEFVGFDSSGQLALFKRSDDTPFPVPEGLPFPVLSSRKLAVGDHLYKTGIADFSIVARDVPYPIHRSVDPASVIGLVPRQTDIFYFEASLSEDDTGSVILQAVDGDLYPAGFFFAPLDGWATETLGIALSIDFTLNALKEMTCSDPSLSCLDFTHLLRVKEKLAKDSQAVQDRYQLMSLLRRSGLGASSLMTDLLKPDVNILSRYERNIAIFQTDETGTIIQNSQVVDGEVTFLSDEYALTSSALFPQSVTLSESGLILATQDVTSNIMFLDEEGRGGGVRIGVVSSFMHEEEMASLLRDIPFVLQILQDVSDPDFLLEMEQSELRRFATDVANLFVQYGAQSLSEELAQNPDDPAFLRMLLERKGVQDIFQEITASMQILDVRLLDRKNGFALLKRSTPSLDAQVNARDLRIVPRGEIGQDQEVRIAYSQHIFRGPSPDLNLRSRLPRISPGTIAYATGNSPLFIVNGFVTRSNLGSPIFAKCENGDCLLGILADTYPVAPDKTQTEGFGLSVDFILKVIKEKTGIEIFPKVPVEEP